MPRGKGKGDNKGTGQALRPGQALLRRLTPEFEKVQLDKDIQSVIAEYTTELRAHEKSKKRNEHDDHLDLIRFAFSLLKQDLGGTADFAKVNPLLIHSYVRSVMTDGYTNGPQNKIINPSFLAFLKAILAGKHVLSESPVLKALDTYRSSPQFSTARDAALKELKVTTNAPLLGTAELLKVAIDTQTRRGLTPKDIAQKQGVKLQEISASENLKRNSQTPKSIRPANPNTRR